MPIYNYECQGCSDQFEVFQSMSEEKLTKCLVCGKRKLSRIPYAPSVIMDAKQPKTVGELAHKNTEEKVARGELDKSCLDYESRTKARKDALNKTREIRRMTPKQKERYIMEGKK
jgi:putative FmdB family regulatory protein